MKVCVSSVGNNLDSAVDPRFGRCAFFLIVDSETGQFEAIANQGANFGGGAGIAAAQLVASHNVKAVVSGNFGPNASGVLQSAGIKIYPGVFNMTAKQVLLALKEDKLQETSQPSGPNYMGMPGGMPGGGGGFGGGGGGFGQGRGGGRGGGGGRRRE